MELARQEHDREHRDEQHGGPPRVRRGGGLVEGQQLHPIRGLGGPAEDLRQAAEKAPGAAPPKTSAKPPNRLQVTYTPTRRNAASFTTDSTATAVISPVCRLVKSRLRAPNRMPKRARVTATTSVGSNTSSTDSSRRIMRNEADTAFSCSAMYGIMPHTTSTATSVPSEADFP